MTGGAEDRRDGSQVVHVLDYLSGDELRAMTDADLSRFRTLLYHWEQMAKAEQERRQEREP